MDARGRFFGSRVRTLVGVARFSNPSNSSSRYDGLRGTCPTTYGRPLSVGAGFQVLDLDWEKRDGSRRRLEEVTANCSLYSNGTNSSKRTRVVDVRGSDVPLVVVCCCGSDLNSIYRSSIFNQYFPLL